TYTATESGSYTVKITSISCESPASNPISVTVNPIPDAAVITAEGQTTFCAGGAVVLKTTTVADSYQWYKGISLIAGATQQTYTATESGNYSVKITSISCESPASNPIPVTVNPIPDAAVITAEGQTTFCAGGAVVLKTITVADSYQWYNGLNLIAGATQQTYTATESGSYTVKITSISCESPASNPIPVTVNPIPDAVVITAEGQTTFCAGGAVVLKTTTLADSYQWYKGLSLITGATQQTYTATESGNYSVKITSISCESPASNPIPVTVNPIPDAAVITAEGQTTFCAGGAVVLTSSATAGNQWFKDGNPITGATGQTHIVRESGKYTVIVTLTNCLSPESARAIITLNPIPAAPTITATNHAVFCEGGHVILTSSENTGNQWYKNGILIPGAIDKNYTATTPGDYSLGFKNSNGCASPISLPTNVTEVQYPGQPQISPSNETTFCEGGVVILTSSSNSGNQWYKNGILIPGATGKTFSVSEIGIYTVSVTNAGGCTSAVSATTTVTVSPVPRGFNDTLSTLSCGESAFSYPLQANINNRAKGGNAVPATFSWTVNTPVLGALDGSGNAIITDLYNPTAIAQEVTYTVTPRGLAGGCDGIPFKITVTVPACIGLSITKIADQQSVSAVGDKINYTIIVKNTGSASHHNVSLRDPLIAGDLRLIGDNGNGILEREESWIYTGTYTVTQSDLDRNGVPTANIGKIQNTATVQTTEHPLVVSATADVAIDQNPKISLVKTGRLNTDLKTITYNFVIKNIGNVTLHHLVLSDPKIPGAITLPVTTFAPNTSITYTGNYTITEDEKLNGNVRNIAHVDGLTEVGEQVSDVSGTNESNDIPTDIDVKRYPAAVDDYANTKTDVEVMVAVAKNDKPSLFPLDVSTVEVQMAPANGTLQMNKDGKIIYQPKKGYSGIEKFSYKIHDAVGMSSNVAMVTINVVPPDLEIPNTFTPNGDGKNDTFQIVGRENYENIDLAVFNRWGDQVYKNNNYKDEWDGAGLNDGTYFYVLKLTKGGVVTSRKSWILIKR
ncbi:gliding motility-associated C-terminal domain-containing protein, partial [Pedobacter sp. N36a]|uniref:Ig-like domain-containing protein n=1 Tax=Pedobacter sp. N36a TaxID=2767996 RepID=UPI00165709CF